MLVNLEKEKDLLEMRQSLPVDYDIFGDNEHQEIIETYDEEEEKQWRVKHRQRQKEYHQKLAKLRAQEKTEIQTEEDLWQRLDELELEEELQDEIDRLQDDACNYYGEDTEENDYYDEEEDTDFSEDDIANDLIQERLVKLKNSEMPKHQKDLLETENVDKEADRSSSLTHDIPNPYQPSSMSSLDPSVIEFEPDRIVIDKDKPKCSLSSQNDMNCVKDHQSKTIGEKLTGQNVSSCFSNQISKSTFSTGEVHSISSTATTNNRLIENSVANKVQPEQSVRFQSLPAENIDEVSASTAAKERDKFSREKTGSDDRITRPETNRRRVSFTDKIQVNVFEKSKHHAFDEPLRTGQESSSESDVEDEVEKLAIIEDMLSVGADPSLINEQIEESTETEDDADDIIRIDFTHSDVQPQIPVRSGADDVIENPLDIYRIFCKPKSILKKSSVNVGDYKNITSPVDDTSDSEIDELPRGVSRTIIVKDVEERKPEVLEVHNPPSKARPLSKFKMARSGIKQ
ncbi:uncharacterized protein LOC124413893 isoform X2 [Diprion similis]|nr:uncharacterized protein LOC124413893 isoform X2 [Diprion similis]XP_046750662.1 uncharacterized protein LOC124413893 isoform X2 [Diprion similis]